MGEGHAPVVAVLARGCGATAGVLFALGVSKGVAVNFSLASGLMLTGAALAAAGLGLSGSLLLSFRERRVFAAPIPASVQVLPCAVPAGCRMKPHERHTDVTPIVLGARG